MERAMLLDDTSTIDANDLPSRESFANHTHSLSIEVRLIVGWHKYCTINDEEVSIGGRKSLTFENDSLWHRQLHQSIRFAI